MYKEIKIYTAEGCQYCAVTKEYMREKGIQYKEIDVSSDEEGFKEFERLLNAGSLPVITINGQVVF